MNGDIKKLRDVFLKNGYSFRVEDFTEDPKILRGIAQREDIDFGIIFLRSDGEYYAYDLESSFLPREIYPDSLKDSFTAAERSREIINTVQGIVSKTVLFHPGRNLFHKNRGYLLLSIDGKPAKIFQTNNHFDLPVETSAN